MKAYLLFTGEHYYPNGGMNDYRGEFDSFDEAKSFFERGFYSEWDDDKEFPRRWDWYQIVQSSDMTIVEEGRA